MNDTPPNPAAAASSPSRSPGLIPPAWLAAGAVLLATLCGAAVVYAWNTQQRVKQLEQDLVRRQQDAGNQSTEARIMAKQAQESSREAAAKLALLDTRVSESSLQRSQLEELIQSLSRSRDENVLADVEAALRVAMQLSALTGSAEPLLTALRQSEERLARHSQPRLERVRRALGHDAERVKSAGVADVSVLTIRLDEAIRLVDDLPLLAHAERRAAPSASREPAKPAEPAPKPAPVPTQPGWQEEVVARWDALWQRVWAETRSLVRVTRIEHPEAALLAPEQAFFLRENLKLRLLNARLALLSRQFDTVQSDLREAQAALERYFERGSRRSASVADILKQVAAQARAVSLPRPDETLAAIAAAGR